MLRVFLDVCDPGVPWRGVVLVEQSACLDRGRAVAQGLTRVEHEQAPAGHGPSMRTRMLDQPSPPLTHGFHGRGPIVVIQWRRQCRGAQTVCRIVAVSYTHLRAHETP